jgi:Flp pilus assembly protein TadG
MVKRGHGEEGNSLIELALSLPFLLLLLLGTFDLGRGFNTYIALANGAREGARWLTTRPTDVDGAHDRIVSEVGRIGLSSGDIAVTITPDQANYPAGTQVTVEVSYDYPLLFGAIQSKTSVPFNVQATMTVLY